MANLNNRGYNEVLNESNDLFASQGISILGAGYSEIATNPALLESYIESLCQGVSADHAAQMANLMVNSNRQILQESSITGISPIASLSMPVIRKLWPKFVLKDALKQEEVKTPRFVVTYTKPYLFNADAEGGENRVYLPRGMKVNNLLQNEVKKTTCVRNLTLTAAAPVANLDLTTAGEAEGDKGVCKVETSSAIKVQPIDNIVIRDIAVGDAVVVKKTQSMDVSNSIFVNAGDVQVVARIVDAKAGKVFVGAMGVGAETTVTLTLEAAVSTEYNETGWSVGFDIGRMDINIPTGEHFNAPLPIEAINDMMALYNIDGTKETVELMTNVISQKLDLEVLEFLSDAYFDQPDYYPARDDYAVELNAADFTYTFDVKPAPGFAGGPKAWREELRPMIDHLAQKIRNNTYYRTGMFNIVCNPIDGQLISNVDWSFRGGQGATMDGVDVDYSVGTYTGAFTYRIIASPMVPEGEMFVLFIPSEDNQMSFKYYPYSFNIEHGYIDNNRSRTPSIMMTKRCALKCFTPAIGNINILNNTGMGQFNTYIPTVNVGEEAAGWAAGDKEAYADKKVTRL